jgi:hypothetical protein
VYDKYLRLRGKGVNSEIISFLDFLSRKAAEFAKVLIAARSTRLYQAGSSRVPAPLTLCVLSAFA